MDNVPLMFLLGLSGHYTNWFTLIIQPPLITLQDDLFTILMTEAMIVKIHDLNQQ